MMNVLRLIPVARRAFSDIKAPVGTTRALGTSEKLMLVGGVTGSVIGCGYELNACTHVNDDVVSSAFTGAIVGFAAGAFLPITIVAGMISTPIYYAAHRRQEQLEREWEQTRRGE